MATTAPLGIAESGVVSRITVKGGAIRGILKPGRTGPDRGATGLTKSSGGSADIEHDFNPSEVSAVNGLFNALMLVLEAWNCRAPAWRVRSLYSWVCVGGVEMAVDLS